MHMVLLRLWWKLECRLASYFFTTEKSEESCISVYAAREYILARVYFYQSDYVLKPLEVGIRNTSTNF